MEPRKHRFTLFLGYGEEAGSLLKRFEQTKFSMGISTNILFLTFLLDFFEQHQNPHEETKNFNEEIQITSQNVSMLVERIEKTEEEKVSPIQPENLVNENNQSAVQAIPQLDPGLCLSTLETSTTNDINLNEADLLSNITNKDKNSDLLINVDEGMKEEDNIEDKIYQPCNKYQKVDGDSCGSIVTDLGKEEDTDKKDELRLVP